jgi:hypothetical protein
MIHELVSLDADPEGAWYDYPASGYGITVRLPREQIERWQQARDAWEDVQDEIRALYRSARTERTVGRSSDRRVCYVSAAGVVVHVKPECRCNHGVP